PASNHHLTRAALLAAVAGVLTLGRTASADDSRWWSPRSLTPLLLAAVALCVPVLVGHTSTKGAASTVGVMSHLAVGGAWLGAVPAVLLLVRSGSPAQPVLSTFSRAATWLLALTLVAGTASAALLSGGPG